ncbi:MAG TPA: hypothetical protein VIM61_00495 [Chthoniobacterales bacterium]
MNEQSLDIQNAYAAGQMERHDALSALALLHGNEEVAAEILGQIDGESDVVEME